MRDEHGAAQKVLVVSSQAPCFEANPFLSDMSPHELREIEPFCRVYKTWSGRK